MFCAPLLLVVVNDGFLTKLAGNHLPNSGELTEQEMCRPDTPCLFDFLHGLCRKKDVVRRILPAFFRTLTTVLDAETWRSGQKRLPGQAKCWLISWARRLD